MTFRTCFVASDPRKLRNTFGLLTWCQYPLNTERTLMERCHYGNKIKVISRLMHIIVASHVGQWYACTLFWISSLQMWQIWIRSAHIWQAMWPHRNTTDLSLSMHMPHCMASSRSRKRNWRRSSSLTMSAPSIVGPLLWASATNKFINIIIINDIYPGSSTHPKVVFREVLHPIELEFGNVDFLRRGKNRRTRRKTSRSRVKNLQPT